MKKFAFAFLYFSTTISAFAQLPNYVPSVGIEGWWSFDGNANDNSFSGNDLTNSGATLTTDRFSNANSACSFNGSNQYLSITNPSFTFAQNSVFTVSFWTQRSAQGYGVTMMNGSGTSGNFIWNFQTGSNGNLQFGTNKQGSAWFWATSTYTPTIWEHFVGIYNNGTMTLYKNGVLVTTVSNTHTSVNSVNLPFYVGRGIAGAYFDGKVDDLGIWSRALTLTEIDALYQGCGILDHPKDSLARIGDDLKLGIRVANPSASVTYQWQMENGAGYWDLHNTGQFSGTDTDSLLISNLTDANDVAHFRCIVDSGTICADTSWSGFLRVCGQITKHPNDTAVWSTDTAFFNVWNNGPGIWYQWQTDTGTGFVNVIINSKYSGAGTPRLAVTNLKTHNDGQKFRCITTTSSWWVCIDTSATGILSVNFVGLEEDLNRPLVSLYPNPSSKILNIKVDASLSNNHYMILNSTGQMVAEGNLLGVETSIDVHAFASGFYTLKMENYSRGFVIEK